MIYKINNVNNDDFIALIFRELEANLKELNDTEIKTVKISNQKKGLDFHSITMLANQVNTLIPAISSGGKEIALALLSSVIYDTIKSVILKYKRIEEYSDNKMIEIEITDSENKKIKVKISLKEFLDWKKK